MKSVIRVDASLQIGVGHVLRCLTLGEYLKDRGVEVFFICRKLPGNFIDQIRLRDFCVFELEAVGNLNVSNRLFHSAWLGVTQSLDAKQCRPILKELAPDYLIVDHYALDYEWESALKDLCKKVMVIDDLADRKHHCDYLLDQTLGRRNTDYFELVPKECEIFTGARYALLRPEFAEWRAYSLDRRRQSQFKTLFINMGGVDAENITGHVLDQLMECNLPSDLEITIVLGLYCPNLESVRAKARRLDRPVTVTVNVDNMAELMSEADVAIGAAGTTSWERCCLGVPTVQFVAASNQAYLAKNLAGRNAAITATKEDNLRSILSDPAEWMRSVSLEASKVTDGSGGLEIVEKMVRTVVRTQSHGDVDVVDYVNLNYEESDYVLRMRNDDSVKKWMYNQQDISLKEHSEFLRSLIGNKAQKYLIVKSGAKIFGSINFSEINLNSSVKLGIFSNPFEKIRGAGRVLEATAVEYAFFIWGAKTIRLEVFSANKRAIRFYKQCAYVTIGSRVVDGKKVYLMEKYRD